MLVVISLQIDKSTTSSLHLMFCFPYQHRNLLQYSFNKEFATEKMKIC